MSDTLCWSCRRAAGGCSWSRSLRPVEGWLASYRPVLMPASIGGKRRYVPQESYIVRWCPQYAPEIMAYSIKEDLAAYLEHWGDARVVSVSPPPQ